MEEWAVTETTQAVSVELLEELYIRGYRIEVNNGKITRLFKED